MSTLLSVLTYPSSTPLRKRLLFDKKILIIMLFATGNILNIAVPFIKFKTLVNNMRHAYSRCHCNVFVLFNDINAKYAKYATSIWSGKKLFVKWFLLLHEILSNP